GRVRCLPSRARAWCSRRRARSFPTTSAWRSRTSASATSTGSCRGPSSSRTSRVFCGCSPVMATDHELRLRERLTRLRSLNLLGGTRLSGELEKLQRQLERIQAAPTDEEIWHSVELARHQDRPYTLDYVERLFEDWVELHGDRGRADDAAVVIGLGRFGGRTVALVGNQKGRDIQE